MENTSQIEPEHKGDSPAKAATKSFLTEFATTMAIFSLVGLVFERIVYKTPFHENTWLRIKEDAFINSIFATGFGLWEARKTYKNTQATKDFYIKPETPIPPVFVAAPEPIPASTSDVALRTELAHTQQALTDVSRELEVVTNHASKLKTPTESHIEQAAMDKAMAEALAGPTIH